MFEIIVIIYCLVGLFLNILMLPYKNKEIHRQNQFIIEKYEHLERVLDKLEQKLDNKWIN